MKLHFSKLIVSDYSFERRLVFAEFQFPLLEVSVSYCHVVNQCPFHRLSVSAKQAIAESPLNACFSEILDGRA